jgi:hypothetical protein
VEWGGPLASLSKIKKVKGNLDLLSVSLHFRIRNGTQESVKRRNTSSSVLFPVTVAPTLGLLHC